MKIYGVIVKMMLLPLLSSWSHLFFKSTPKCLAQKARHHTATHTLYVENVMCVVSFK